jgi:hypothetical protein
MATLQVSGIADLVASTLSVLGKLKITDLQRDVQTYRAFNRLLRKSQITEQGGASIKINVLTDMSNNARFKGLYEIDPDASQDDAQTTGDVPWRFADYYWCYDETEMDVNNAGETQIQDYIRLKRYRAFTGWATFIENWFWGLPPATTDTKTPYPLRYWLTKNVTSTGIDGTVGNGNFSGSVPTGSDGVAHTTVGGINPTTYTKWKNFTYKYTDVSDDDLLTRMRDMIRYIDFEPPAGMSYPQHAGGPSHEHLVPLEILTAFERLVERRNDNLGFDLSVRTPTFGRAPLTWVRQLADDSDDPIYTMDWGAWNTVLLRGKWQKEKPAVQSPRQHSVWVNWVVSSFQNILWDRRRCAVGSRAAANA